jgi:Nucleoside recognition.
METINKHISAWNRIKQCVKEVIPSTTKTCIWLLKITIGVSILILVLRYLKILPWFSNAISPLFNYIGLPGEAALSYVTGFFVNVYAAIPVAVSCNLDVRSLTILSVMILCSHNMITETAVQKKTGSSAIRMVIIRIASAFILAFVLNKILPGSITENTLSASHNNASLTELLDAWWRSTLSIIIKMSILIYSLAILQKILSEFGVIRWISKFLRPILAFFGLPAKTSFLWIVANILGLAYGAAVMMEETNAGKVNKKEIDLLNTHISISHSNLEDLILLSSIGGIWYVLLLTRWAGSFLLVWEQRLEYYIKEHKKIR